MKTLALSDEAIERLYNVRVRETYPDVRMLFGCGDLPYEYLEFLVTVFNVPLFYVPGNHDPKYADHSRSHVEGGINLDGKVRLINGLGIAGLGGSIKYNPGGPNQYTQHEMYLRAYQLLPKILLNSFRRQRHLDILLTHSPPYGIHDDDDPAHQGLRALNLVLQVAKPRFMLHGHTIFYQHNIKSHITNYHQTQVINIYPFRLLEVNV
jgi:Icc-related predicted phosphoesterase